MARKGARKLFLFGRYSLALLLPKKWLREIGAERNEMIALTYDRARRRIVLKFGTTGTKTPPVKKNPDRTDLQPIPEI